VSNLNWPALQPSYLTKKQVMLLIQTAKTPEDHLKLSRYYDQDAAAALVQSKKHEQMAEAYKKNPMNTGTKFFTATIGHCEYLAQSYREAAEKMKAMAAEHRAMAENSGK
jgi:hypothetical protein